MTGFGAAWARVLAPPDHSRTPWLAGLAGAVASAGAAVWLVGRPSLLIMLVALAIAGAVVHAGADRPTTVIVLLAAVLVFVPFYAGPSHFGVLLQPASAVGWLLIAALAARAATDPAARIRVSPIDVLFVVFMASLLIAPVFGARRFIDVRDPVFNWAGIYIAGRLAFSRVVWRGLFIRAFVLSSLALVPFVIVEAKTGANPFRHIALSEGLVGQYDRSPLRLGLVRAQAGWGHSIALASLFAVAAILSVGLAAQAARGRRMWMWLGAAGALVGGQVLTVSRTGWITLLPGLCLLLLRVRTGRVQRGLLLGAAAVFTVALAVARFSGATTTSVVVTPIVGGNDEFARTQGFRQELIEKGLTPGALHWTGNRDSVFSEVIRSGLTTVDNTYLYLADRWGLMTMFAFGALIVAVLAMAATARLDVEDASLVAAMAGLAVGCIAVGLITQQQLLVFLMLGAVGAACQRRGRPLPRSQRGPAPARLR